MGRYLNPGNCLFAAALNSQIYVDKSELIAYTNRVLLSEQRYICVSRPRRFGKSMAANMLVSYYGRDADSRDQFEHLKIAKEPSYEYHLNKYNVIFLNMQDFLSSTHDIEKMILRIGQSLLRDMKRAYPDIDYLDGNDLVSVLFDIYEESGIPFVFIIDEWDCIFRENKDDGQAQKKYLDFLRNLLKDKAYVALAYMTGILPIKKYGSHSALNMFDEFSMTNPRQLAEFVGFTEEEVRFLCTKFHMDFEETRCWYDGYRFENTGHIYSPRSVVSAMLSGCFDNYWNQTETFEALRNYISLNYAGLKDTVIELLAGKSKKINVNKFTNDMTSFKTADDVLTLLVHLGYLGYDHGAREVFIPNSEVASEFYNAVEDTGWENVMTALQQSENKPAMVIELKWNQSEEGAIQQIKNKQYLHALEEYKGNVLLVGVNYDKNTKIHRCVIEDGII